MTLFLFTLVSSHYKVSYTMAGRREGRTTMVRRLQVAARYLVLGWDAQVPWSWVGMLRCQVPGSWEALDAQVPWCWDAPNAHSLHRYPGLGVPLMYKYPGVGA